MEVFDLVPSVMKFKHNHGRIYLATQDHTKIIRSGWGLMDIITRIIDEICPDCIVSAVCSGACQNYYTVYGAMMGWLSGCTYKVEEDELMENLGHIMDTLVE